MRGGPFIGKCICEFVGFLIFFIPLYWLGLKISWLKDLFFFGILFSLYRCFISFSIFDFSISSSFDLRFLSILFAMFSSFISAGKRVLVHCHLLCLFRFPCNVISLSTIQKFISLCIKVLFSLLLPLEMTSFGLVLFRWTEYLGLGKAKAKVPHHFQSILEARVLLHFVPGSCQGLASPSLCLDLLGCKVSLL